MGHLTLFDSQVPKCEGPGAPGYFSRQERFWTNEEFPDAAGVRGRTEARIKSIGLNDPSIQDAWETLGSIPKDTAQ
jgi:hypothetical protein